MPSPLLSIIVDRIRTNGPMTVADYVEAALYHPEFGYYASSVQRSGRGGDFFTSVDLGSLFGELLAVQVAEMARILATHERQTEWHGRLARAGDRLDACPTQTGTFDLVEAAAGNGRLSRDVLDHLAAHAPDVHRSIRLHLVERSPTARSSQRGVLGPHSDRLTTSAADVPEAIRGLIFANELLDALPPHLVVMRTGGLREVFVTASGDRLHTVEAEPSSSRLGAYLDHVRARLEPGWFAEVNLAAIDWIRRAAERLQAGFLLLIDYGHEAPSLFSASRRGGTLTAYHRHTSEGRDDGPSWLAEPGERDITSHVDLTGVRLAAEAAGLTTLGIIDQGYFLLGLGLADRLFESSDPSPRGLARRLALKSLLLPAGLGSTHKVLVFARGLGQPTLAGFSFARRLT